MTDTRRETEDESTPMRDVSHTNPYTDESMGSVFEHGVTIVADGGRRDAVDDAEPATADADTDAAAADEETEPAAADADATAAEAAAEDADDATDDDDDATPMKDVSHEAPDGGHGNRMFERVGDTTDVSEE